MARALTMYKGWLDKSKPEYTKASQGTNNGKEWRKCQFKFTIPTGKGQDGKNTYMSRFLTAWGPQAKLVEQLADGKSLELTVTEKEEFWEKDGERKYKTVYTVMEIDFPLPDIREAAAASDSVMTTPAPDFTPAETFQPAGLDEELPFD